MKFLKLTTTTESFLITSCSAQVSYSECCFHQNRRSWSTRILFRPNH